MNCFRLSAVTILAASSLLFAQEQSPPPETTADQAAPPPAAPLNPEQLQDLVAPIALYPDTLLSEILAASTYPIEVVEAQQWLQQNRNLKGQQLMDAAKQQNWDPSVQALVAFPDVLARLNQDVRWTTDLGNAFLAQQADVMNAVQQLRMKAQANGKLKSTSQENVATETQNGQSAITIAPADPGVVYVPYYNPVFVWGPPVWGYYPPWVYPGIDVGFSFFPGIDLGLYFGGWGGWGWGGWGWAPNWWGGGIFIDGSFFHRFGFRDYHGIGRGGGVWAHDPGHRLGVPYGNREVANRFGRGEGGEGRLGGRTEGFGRAGEARPQQRFGDRGFEDRGYTGNHSVFGGYHNGGMTRMQSDRGFSSIGGGRGFGGGGGFHGGGGGGFHGGGGRR